MKRKTGLALLIASIIPSCAQLPAINPFQKETFTKTKENLELITNHVNQFGEYFITEIKGISDEIRIDIHKLGKEKVIKEYIELHLSALELALQPGKEIEKIAKQATEKLFQRAERTKHSKLYIKYDESTRKDLEEKFEDWLEIRAEFFEELMENNPRANSFQELLKSKFSKEEYETHLEEITKISDEIYGVLKKHKTEHGSNWRQLVDGKLDEISDRAKNIYFETLETFYQESKQEITKTIFPKNSQEEKPKKEYPYAFTRFRG